MDISIYVYVCFCMLCVNIWDYRHMNFMYTCSHIVCMFLCIRIRIHSDVCEYVGVYVDNCIQMRLYFGTCIHTCVYVCRKMYTMGHDTNRIKWCYNNYYDVIWHQHNVNYRIYKYNARKYDMINK